ncbi:MAG: HAMP domain-containing protein [Lachnospiraceae bacterium]|nr:HAMP domain-containing protein [Lachnospiraceae bacterium]
MKRTLLIKLTLCYLIASVTMFILLNSVGVNMIEESLIEKKKAVMYEEAGRIAEQYLENIYTDYISSNLARQLRVLDVHLDSRIWIVDTSGNVIADTRGDGTEININDYDETFLENTFYRGTKFKGVFNEPMLSVIRPIPYNYAIRGYVCLHTSLEGVTEEGINYMDMINICYLVFLGFLLLIFLYLYIATIRPVKVLKKAAREFGKGHFEYPLKLSRTDEYGDLGAAIQFMATELKNLEDYQKKFVANISHDFRSPLTSIKGYAEAILDGTIPYEMKDKYMGIILFETERLTKLTTNLLELNSFEAKGMHLNVTMFDINSVIKSTAASFEGTCTKKRLTLNLEFSEKELYVEADVDKIQQVLYNLLDNAIKFSHNDSSIRISTEQRGKKVFVGVKDHGIGIPKDSLNKIWERFYKTDASRGKDKKGVGLGLSITKEIITAHGENINVVSTEGVGTEFIFTLPVE